MPSHVLTHIPNPMNPIRGFIDFSYERIDNEVASRGEDNFEQPRTPLA